MTETEGRLTRVEDKLDDVSTRLTRVESALGVLTDQWEKRFSVLQWTVTIGFTWLTLLITVIALVKR